MLTITENECYRELHAIPGHIITRRLHATDLDVTLEHYEPDEMLEALDSPDENDFDNGERFAFWTILEKPYGRISLLYIGGEGSQTAKELYLHEGRRRTRPKGIALIRCYFGGAGTCAWMNMYETPNPLSDILLHNPEGGPDFVLTESVNRFHWDGYEQAEDAYHRGGGSEVVCYFRRKDE
jgi:hypothetical protein